MNRFWYMECNMWYAYIVKIASTLGLILFFVHDTEYKYFVAGTTSKTEKIALKSTSGSFMVRANMEFIWLLGMFFVVLEPAKNTDGLHVPCSNATLFVQSLPTWGLWLSMKSAMHHLKQCSWIYRGCQCRKRHRLSPFCGKVYSKCKS